MMSLFREILYRPLFNIVVFLYNILPTHDFGLAIILLTLIIRIIFFPLSIKSMKSQKAMNELNPKLKEIKEKYKNDQAAQSKATMELYKERGVNPIAGCLPLLIQLPILIALYQAFIAGFKPESFSLLYGFIKNPGVINQMFLGFINITKSNPALALIAGGLQFIQSRQSASFLKAGGGAGSKEMAAINSQMLYFFPIFIIIFGWKLPAGLVLYWIATTVFSIIEQLYLRRQK